MWICTKTVSDFLKGKDEKVIHLFNHFLEEYRKVGDFKLHPAKSRIGFAAKIRFGYIHRLGKDFVDVVFTFPKAFDDNLCFYRIGEVPGGKIFQHYLRLQSKYDISEEVKKYMTLAFQYGNKQEMVL